MHFKLIFISYTKNRKSHRKYEKNRSENVKDFYFYNDVHILLFSLLRISSFYKMHYRSAFFRGKKNEKKTNEY